MGTRTVYVLTCAVAFIAIVAEVVLPNQIALRAPLVPPQTSRTAFKVGSTRPAATFLEISTFGSR